MPFSRTDDGRFIKDLLVTHDKNAKASQQAELVLQPIGPAMHYSTLSMPQNNVDFYNEYFHRLTKDDNDTPRSLAISIEARSLHRFISKTIATGVMEEFSILNKCPYYTGDGRLALRAGLHLEGVYSISTNRIWCGCFNCTARGRIHS